MSKNTRSENAEDDQLNECNIKRLLHLRYHVKKVANI